jgi:hypothetical protein
VSKAIRIEDLKRHLNDRLAWSKKWVRLEGLSIA